MMIEKAGGVKMKELNTAATVENIEAVKISVIVCSVKRHKLVLDNN